MAKKITKKATKKATKKVGKKKVVKKVAPKKVKVEVPKLEDQYPIYLVDFLVREFYFDGNSEAKRAIKEGRVTLNGEVTIDTNLELQPEQEVNVEVNRDGSGSTL